MVDLQRYRATSGERNFTEPIKATNFRGGSFSNRDNVKAPIQFRRKRQSQHLKRWFFLKNRLIYFYINSTSVIRPVKWNKFFEHHNQHATSCPSPQCLVDQTEVQQATEFHCFVHFSCVLIYIFNFHHKQYTKSKKW